MEYDDESVKRHWSPQSEDYAPAEALQVYLADGWELDRQVSVELFLHNKRSTHIYYFKLRRGDIEVWMPVLENPVVLRLIMLHQITLHQADPHCCTTETSSHCKACSTAEHPGNGRHHCWTHCECTNHATRLCCCPNRLFPKKRL